MKKNIFIARHKWSNMIENQKRFLNKIKKLKLHLVKFKKDDTIKDKTYLLDYVVRDKNCQPVIIITYYKCMFLANNNICKAWTRVADIFLYFNI